MRWTASVISMAIVSGSLAGGCSCSGNIHGTPDDTAADDDVADTSNDVQDDEVMDAGDGDDGGELPSYVPIAVRSGQQSVPKVAALPDGGAWISWYSWESGNYNVRLQRIDAQGRAQLGSEGVLVSDSTSEGFTMDQLLVALPGGDAVVAFQDVRSGDFEAYAYRVSAEGEHLWGDDGVRVFGDAPSDIVKDMIVDEDGDVVIAAERATDPTHVKLQRLSASGDKQWGTGHDITAPEGDFCVRPVLADAGSGAVIAVWLRAPGLMDTGRTVMARKVDPSGSPAWTADAVLGTGDEIPYYVDPVIEPDGSGGVFAAWTIAQGISILHVRLQHLDASGSSTMGATPVMVSSSNATSQSAPALSWLGMLGQVMVFWRETDFDESESGIMAQRFTMAGDVSWSTTGLVAVPVSSTTLASTGVARYAGGGAVMFYRIQDAGSFDSDYSQGLLEAVDAPIFAPHEITDTASAKLWPDVSSEPSDGWWMVWGDQRADDGDIYAAHIPAY